MTSSGSANEGIADAEAARRDSTVSNGAVFSDAASSDAASSDAASSDAAADAAAADAAAASAAADRARRGRRLRAGRRRAAHRPRRADGRRGPVLRPRDVRSARRRLHRHVRPAATSDATPAAPVVTPSEPVFREFRRTAGRRRRRGCRPRQPIFVQAPESPRPRGNRGPPARSDCWPPCPSACCTSRSGSASGC